MALFSTDFKTISLKQVIGLIVAVNLAVFIFLNIAARFLTDTQWTDELFLDSDVPFHLWSLATYSFCHISFSHMIVNMTVLILAGFIIETKSIKKLTAKNVAAIYLASALGGGIAFLVSSHHSNVLIGASAAVMGLAGALAVACYKTSVTLPFPGRINLMTLIFILLAWVLIATSTTSPETTIVHSAGLATGILTFALLSLFQRYKSYHSRSCEQSNFERLNLKVRTSGYASLNDEERYLLLNHNQNQANQESL